MKVEDANFLRKHHGPNGLEAGAVVGFLVLAVLYETASEDVLFELRP